MVGKLRKPRIIRLPHQLDDRNKVPAVADDLPHGGQIASLRIGLRP
jgi:hypothetical protein